MRKLTLTFGLLLFVVVVWAQVPVSMRYYALGTALDGDWEQIYDPIDLNFYLQKYYFTNLSDYVQQMSYYDGEIQLVDNSKFLSEYPFGFTFKNPWKKDLKHAFLIRFRDDKVPYNYNGYGEQEMKAIAYSDNDMDLIYDTKIVGISRTKNYDNMHSRLLLLLNSSLPVGDNIFGVRLLLDTGESEWDDASNDYNAPFLNAYIQGFSMGDGSSYLSYTIYDIIEDIMTDQYIEEGNFESCRSNNKIQGLFSWMKPSNWFGADGEIRYDLNLTFDDENSYKADDKYSAEYYNYLSETSHEEGQYKIDYDRTSKLPRNEAFLNAKYRKNLDNVTPRYKQSFWEIGLGIGGFGGDYKDDLRYSTTSNQLLTNTETPDLQELDTLTEITNQDISGSYLGWHTKLIGRSAVNFSENVSFGYGLTFDLQTFNRKADMNSYLNRVTYHQEGLDFDDINDIRTTERTAYKSKNELAQTNLQTILPIGLEFSMPKTSLTDHDDFGLRNFTFRLGTTFIHNYKFRDYRTKIDEMEYSTIITEDGSGNVSESHSDDNMLYAFKNKSSDSMADKRYSAGIGYNHSEFLNIDIGGYINGNGDEFFIGAMFTVKK